MMHEVNETEAAAPKVNETEAAITTELQELERETAAANNKELTTAESQIYSDLTVSIEKLKSQLKKTEAI